MLSTILASSQPPDPLAGVSGPRHTEPGDDLPGGFVSLFNGRDLDGRSTRQPHNHHEDVLQCCKKSASIVVVWLATGCRRTARITLVQDSRRATTKSRSDRALYSLWLCSCASRNRIGLILESLATVLARRDERINKRFIVVGDLNVQALHVVVELLFSPRTDYY